MIKAYNHSTLTLKHDVASTVAVKGLNAAVQLYSFSSGVASINLDAYAEGQYQIQYLDAADAVIQEDILFVRQNLKYAASTYDGRSANRIALQAITAFLEGRATAQQRRVKVGEKEIQYSSFDQLIKWKNYFEQQVRKQEGKAKTIRHEKLVYRGL